MCDPDSMQKGHLFCKGVLASQTIVVVLVHDGLFSLLILFDVSNQNIVMKQNGENLITLLRTPTPRVPQRTKYIRIRTSKEQRYIKVERARSCSSVLACIGLRPAARVRSARSVPQTPLDIAIAPVRRKCVMCVGTVDEALA